MVVFAHSNEQFMTGLHRAWRDIGWSGVDLFFVISGFVMTYTVRYHHYSRMGFLFRRIARIVPMYWAVTLLTAALALFAPSIFKTTHFGWSNFIQSCLFFPSRDPINGEIKPLLHLGWTVNFEMLFYVLFSLLLNVTAWKRTAALLFGFGILIMIRSFAHPTLAPLIAWGDPVTLEFVFGCAVAADYINFSQPRFSLIAAITLLVTSICLIIVGSSLDDGLGFRWFFRGIPAAGIVLAAVAIGRSRMIQSSFLHRIGDATYSIYLTHIFVVMGIRKLWLAANLPTTDGSTYFFVAACLLLAGIVGVYTYEHIEKRLTQVARRLLQT